jgi:hypothetical protein
VFVADASIDTKNAVTGESIELSIQMRPVGGDGHRQPHRRHDDGPAD